MGAGMIKRVMLFIAINAGAILLMLTLAMAVNMVAVAIGASTCMSKMERDGKSWAYRIIDGRKCWYQGAVGRDKNLLSWGNSPPIAPSEELVETPAQISLDGPPSFETVWSDAVGRIEFVIWGRNASAYRWIVWHA